MNNPLVKVEESIIPLKRVKTINLIGDPGCDGLGATTMSIFARALICAPADFSIVLGDLVPFGSRQIYKNVCEFVDTLAVHPVYTLCGNHDTDYYDEYFGKRNYALVSDELLLLVLDNSRRVFTPETLEFCRKSLEEYERNNIVILFHIPPPNQFTTNSVNPPEWDQFREIYLPYQKQIKYFISGHVHSCFEDQIDDIPIIISGGGGARIEFVNERINDNRARHHIVQLSFDEQHVLSHKYIYLDSIEYTRELKDINLKNHLENALRNEITAHFKYKLLSVNAKERGWDGLAKLFAALSDSEFHHARNHYYVLNKDQKLVKDIEQSIRNETWEVEKMYREYKEYAQIKQHGLSKYTFNDALEAEKIHKGLLEKALEYVQKDTDIPVTSYYTCSSCGYTFEAENTPKRCPVCGAPEDKILPVECIDNET